MRGTDPNYPVLQFEVGAEDAPAMRRFYRKPWAGACVLQRWGMQWHSHAPSVAITAELARLWTAPVARLLFKWKFRNWWRCWKTPVAFAGNHTAAGASAERAALRALRRSGRLHCGLGTR